MTLRSEREFIPKAMKKVLKKVERLRTGVTTINTPKKDKLPDLLVLKKRSGLISKLFQSLFQSR